MRIFLLVIDSFGIGEMPDADLFHDEGSNTYGNLYARTGVNLPNLIRFGLNNIDGVANLSFPDGKILRPCAAPVAAYGRMAEKTFAKDTTALRNRGRYDEKTLRNLQNLSRRDRIRDRTKGERRIYGQRGRFRYRDHTAFGRRASPHEASHTLYFAGFRHADRCGYFRRPAFQAL